MKVCCKKCGSCQWKVSFIAEIKLDYISNLFEKNEEEIKEIFNCAVCGHIATKSESTAIRESDLFLESRLMDFEEEESVDANVPALC